MNFDLFSASRTLCIVKEKIVKTFDLTSRSLTDLLILNLDPAIVVGLPRLNARKFSTGDAVNKQHGLHF